MRNTLALVGYGSMVGRAVSAALGEAWKIIRVGRGAGSDVMFDLAHGAHAQQAPRADALLHCAAGFGNDSYEQAVGNAELNGIGALRVAQLAERMECRQVVYISSVSALPENRAASSYGLSKHQGHEWLEFASRQRGADYTALLPTQLYDAQGLARRHQGFFYHMLDCAAAGRDIELYGKADPLRDMLHVDDLAKLIAAVLERKVTGLYPVLSPHSHTVSEVAAIMQAAFGRGGQVLRREDKPDLGAYFIPDDRRIHALAGVRPRMLAEGVKSLVPTYKPKAAG